MNPAEFKGWKTIAEMETAAGKMKEIIDSKSNLIVIIYEKQGKGAVIKGYRVFHAEGELEGFVDTLAKDALFLVNHSKNKSTKFLLPSVKPEYISSASEQRNVIKKIAKTVENLEIASNLTKEIAKIYGIKLKELHNCKKEIRAALFAEPLATTLLGLIGKAISKEIPKEQVSEEIIIGTNRKGEIIKEELAFFENTLIQGQSKEGRLAILQVLLESFLLTGIPAVVIDTENKMELIAKPRQNSSELQEKGLNFEPIGFPTKIYEIGKNIHVNLKAVNADVLFELFGFGENIAANRLKEIYDTSTFTSLEELMRFVENSEEDEEWNAFQKRRSKRFVKILSVEYENYLNGANNIEELTKGFFGKLGRASIIKMHEDRRLNTIFVASFLSEIANVERKRFAIFIPEFNNIVGVEPQTKIENFIIEKITEIKSKGIATVLSLEDYRTLTKELQEATILTAVKENDVAVEIPGRQAFRAILRPTVSQPIARSNE